jgi:hypothetical protein
MNHGRTHVKAWLLWVDEKAKQEKKNSSNGQLLMLLTKNGRRKKIRSQK